MTDYIPYPHLDVTLEGKVAGTVNVWFRGDSIGAMTDGRKRLSFRDRLYTCHIEMRRDADGTIVESGALNSVQRDDWTYAPPTFAKAITNAVLDAVAGVWTPELERRGLEADVAQKLSSLEGDERDTKMRLAAILLDMNEQHNRLEA